MGEDVDVQSGGLIEDGGLDRMYLDRLNPAYKPGRYSHLEFKSFEDTSFRNLSWEDHWFLMKSIAGEENNLQALELDFSKEKGFAMSVFEQLEREGKIEWEGADEKATCPEPGSDSDRDHGCRQRRSDVCVLLVSRSSRPTPRGMSRFVGGQAGRRR